jgi:thioredoxin 1
MATLEVTEKNFEETIGKGIVLLDWWAEWCGPCRRFAPIYEEASGRHADVVFGKVDTEAQPALAGEFGIRSIPTIMAFREGILLFAQPGSLPGEVLDELIGKLREVDMDEVRRRVSEAAEAAEAAAAQGEK